jgi:hypothetical protein
MKLSFFPGELYLTKEQDGSYVVTVQDQEVLRTRQEKKALAQFNKLRREMESRFPPHELTPEEKRALLQKLIGDALVSHNGDRHSKKKIKSGSTRTFG